MSPDYKIGSPTQVVSWSDIKHLDLFSLAHLRMRGWTKRDIKHYLGAPDFEIRRGRYNTGVPRKWWRAERVEQMHDVRTGDLIRKSRWWRRAIARIEETENRNIKLN